MSSELDPLYLRLHELVTLQLNGDASVDADEELAQLLRENAEAQRVYVEYMNETVELGWWSALGATTHSKRMSDQLGRLESETHSAASVPRRSYLPGSWSYYVAVACSALLAGLAVVWWLRGDNGRMLAEKGRSGAEIRAGANQLSVATLVRATDAMWRPSSPKPADFSRLDIGRVLALERGQCELLFDTGVEVVAKGPCRIQITSANSIFAELGAVSARVGKCRKGFTIDTPNAQLVDLGTEFGVDVSATGTTDVVVFDGIVNLSRGHAGLESPDRLIQGDAVKVLNSGHTSRLVAFDSLKFPSAGGLRYEAANRQPIITSVSDNIDDGTFKKAYRINRGGLREDCPAFVDRDHEWNGVDQRGLPRELLGAEYVMPFNDDKFISDLQMHFEISCPAIVWVIISKAVVVPEWLTSRFEKTDLTVGLDEGPFSWAPERTVDVGPGKSIDTEFAVWRRIVRQPCTLTLGGVAPLPDTTIGYNMYGVAAAKLTDDALIMSRSE